MILGKVFVIDCKERFTVRPVVVAQLAERLLPKPQDPGSNPAISNFYKEHFDG